MHKWFTINRGEEPMAIDVQGDHSSRSDTVFFNESSFHDLLAIERKRAERSKKPFMLLLVDIRTIVGRNPKKSIVNRVLTAIEASSREIDLKGWYEAKRVVGVIYTELSCECKKLIISKIRTKLADEFSEISTATVELNAIFFPRNGHGATDHEAIARFYPELLDKPLTTMVSLFIKRTIDIIGSLFGLLICSPLFIIIPILIKRDSKGPVFFRQKRVGHCGKTFTFLKFRSMVNNNDSTEHEKFVQELIHPSKPVDAGSTQFFKMMNDRRVTGIGKLLRKTSIDELPQLINVLLGDMSLVGPRPAIPYEVNKYQPWHLQRIFPLKPGITGVWQVRGRSQTTFDTMVRMDIEYIRNWSILLDLKLLCLTPYSVLSAKGAV